MRILVLSADAGNGMLSFIMRAMDDGHAVKWYFSKPIDWRAQPVGKGIADIVHDWRGWARWADLIVLDDNTKHLTELDVWRRDRGARVIGATSASAAWELDRKTGMDIFKSAGIPTPPVKEFDRYDDAIRYVEREGRAFCSKPNGDTDNKGLSYVSKSAADMIFQLRKWKGSHQHRDSFILQEKVSGVEFAVGAWVGPNGFTHGWTENFETKKLHAGDLGPNCFPPDSEVLTSRGWVQWPDVRKDDNFCTLKEGRIVYDHPERIVVGDFDGELIGWKTPYVDILVTPGHSLYVQDDHYRREPFFEAAHEAEAKVRTVLRTGGEWFDTEPDMTDRDYGIAALSGAYVADGYLRKDGRAVVFGNCPPHKRPEFTEFARRAGFEAKMYGPDLYINSREAVALMATCGSGSAEKRAPTHVLGGGRQIMRAFLEGLAAGDGTRRKGNLTITTVSPQLADDVQEMALKVGWAANVSTRDRRGETHTIAGYECVNRRVAYDIRLSTARPKAEITPKSCRRERYAGKVYCVTVPSHVIYVRRNGKACWIGQTGEMGTTLMHASASKLAQKVLKPLEDRLVASGHTGYVDVNCIVSPDGTPWPLEFTMRFGWPTFPIQQALLAGDCAEWLLDLAEGRDARPWITDEVAVGVVVACGSFPHGRIPKEAIVGIPIYGAEGRVLEDLHFCEVMAGMAPHDVDGRVVDRPTYLTAGDYVMSATGTGETVTAARRRAYAVLDKISMPSSPFWRVDIGRRLAKCLPELQAHGMAQRWSYG